MAITAQPSLGQAAIDSLRSSLRGPLLAPGTTDTMRHGGSGTA